jgi:hypothetical protein
MAMERQMTAADMVIEALAADASQAEDALVTAVAEGESYRACLRAALALYAEERQKSLRLERRCKESDRRMREFLGDEEMHPEQGET